VILVDATKGLLPQTRRHTHIASLLGIPNLLVAINKLTWWIAGRTCFSACKRIFSLLPSGSSFLPRNAFPLARSAETTWRSEVKGCLVFGPTLLEHLETVISARSQWRWVRFPIQYVIRPDASFSRICGQVAGGILRQATGPGAPVRQKTRVQSIVTYDGELREAGPSMSVTVKLEDEIDLSAATCSSPPARFRECRADWKRWCWLHPSPLELSRVYLVKHAGRLVKAKATQIRYRVDVNTLAHAPAHQLEMNSIAAVEFETNESLFFDSYRRNRTTGSFI